MDFHTLVPGLEERFLRYVRIDSPADESSGAVPSTTSQWDILRPLEAELRDLGAAVPTVRN